MTVSYPISLPTTPGLRRIKLTAINAVSRKFSPFSFTEMVQKHAGQRWHAEVTLPPMDRTSADDWINFLLLLEGTYNTFLLGDPLKKSPRGVATGTPKVNGASQTGNSLNTKGWTPSITGILRQGDYIQIGQRLYFVRETVNSDVSGNTSLNIWPRLRESPADNTSIVTTNTVGTFRLESNLTDLYEADADKICGISFTAIEAI